MTSAAGSGFFFLTGPPKHCLAAVASELLRRKKRDRTKEDPAGSGAPVFSRGRRSSPHDFGFESKTPARSGFLTDAAQMFLSDLFLFVENGWANNPWKAFL